MESKAEWIAVSENNGQIVEALNAAALEIGPVAKSGKAAQQMGGYSFRTIDDVVNACSGPMARNGLIVIPAITETKSEA